ncbi:MAG: C40 family peptidase [Clostridiales bacterium]|nr:C40 family peptidase [Clostridiales bacterium]
MKNLYKKILISLVIIATILVVPTIKASASEEDAPQFGELVKTVRVGEQVTAIDGKNGWWMIAENGKLAWINAGPTTYWDSNESVFPIKLRIEKDMPAYEVQTVYNYKKGQAIQTVSGGVDGWWKVKTPDGFYGWVNAGPTYYNSSGQLVASQDISAYFIGQHTPLQVVKTVNVGENIKAIDGRDGWWMIAEGGKLAWCNAGPTSYYDSNQSVFPIYLVVNKQMQVNEAGIAYTYSKDEKIEVVSGGVDGWWKVRTPNGYYGWVNAGPTYYNSSRDLLASTSLSAYFSGRQPIEITNQQKIVDEALKHLGKTYVWGATGPNTFDCSGFTQYVYREALGIGITRTTYTQVNQGIEVSANALQPGDLIFPHADHVQIYIGNGQVIHAPQTGDVVRIAPIGNVWHARRIIY